MLRLKTIDAVRTTGARKTGNRAVTGVLAVGLLVAGAVQGHGIVLYAADDADRNIEDRGGSPGNLRQQI
jgi:hypothetical protein